MELKRADELLNEIINKSADYGFEDANATYTQDRSVSIDILKGEVSNYEYSSEQGTGFRGKYNGQMGKASSSDIDKDTAEYLLSEAKANAEILDDEDEDFFYCDPDNSDLRYEGITGIMDKADYDTLSKTGLSLEKAILAFDPRITDVDYLSVGATESVKISRNTKGLKMFKASDDISVAAEARAEFDGVVKTASHFWYGTDLKDYDETKFVKTLADKLLSKFGAKSVRSSNYDIVLSNEATESLIDNFFTVFSSYTMQQGLSILAGKEGEKIASELITLKEIPSYDKALLKFPFDEEGVMIKEKSIIKNGVFETALYNLKTAHKEGKKSTGNGYGGSVESGNIILMPGDKDLDALCGIVGNGLYITDLAGLHAGINTISGDFSLLCEGYLIENGKIGRAVEQITIADNFIKVLEKVTAVGNDMYGYPGDHGETFCPSIVIRDVSVAGEE